MKRVKNIMIYTIFCIIIFTSLKLPKILVKIEDDKIKNEIYEKKNNQISLNIEVENIYLVKVLHAMNLYLPDIREQSIWDNIYNEKHLEGEGIDQKIKNEIEKLKELEIIKNIEINDKLDEKMICREYYGVDEYFTIFEIYTDYCVIEMEQKTGKIISIVVKRKNNINKEIEKEEALRRYIQYLDLYVIDDWEFENDTLKSEKAKLVVSIEEDIDFYYLSIKGIEGKEIEQRIKE